jgi:hypothetical protein
MLLKPRLAILSTGFLPLFPLSAPIVLAFYVLGRSFAISFRHVACTDRLQTEDASLFEGYRDQLRNIIWSQHLPSTVATMDDRIQFFGRYPWRPSCTPIDHDLVGSGECRRLDIGKTGPAIVGVFRIWNDGTMAMFDHILDLTHSLDLDLKFPSAGFVDGSEDAITER